ncbi:MAG: EAL domain-containing response regulator [Anderseniella sp.]|jgi:EAL domain-containing protein (putative c-di-GMP-specific phosphodiesterase class I)|nr:EAL domain-containing response regulator [Anderseniella sp.]
MFPERMMVVDDDPLVPSIAKAYFRAHGVLVCDLAADGEEAVQLSGQSVKGYDFILCDICMPRLDGIQLISALARAGYKGWIGILSSQHPTLARTALNIAESYGMRPAGVGRKPLDQSTLARFLKNIREGHARVRPASAPFALMPVSDLEQAITENRIVPFYQPIVELHSTQITGAEALARMVAPDGSIIPPAAFIELAETSGLLEPLTQSLFNTVLRDLQRLNSIHPNLNLAINWDPKLLERQQLPDELTHACETWGISPTQITLEITETTAFEASSTILEVLVRLRLKGFGVAVDDYGTGYSNLDRLARMPFSKLKIDQSFVRKAGEDSFSMAGVETAIRLARELSMPTVAEGVEDEKLWQIMRACGASLAQGYLMSRPLPIDQFIDWGEAIDWRFELPSSTLPVAASA